MFPFISEGSEDEIEVSTQNLELEDQSMERAMVPPHMEAAIQHYPNTDYRSIYGHCDDMVTDSSPKISVKHAAELFDKAKDQSEELQRYISETKQLVNGKIDIFYLRAREIILASGSLPGELELRETGVFAKTNICKGTRYGPFQGKMG
ncbi:hypothetical protein NQ318_021865 [Aromia moschata]|uniref:Uncharacterized protein n=1 Tax=Aromia moschata TaxID=1265417 RepID=A0AAV8Z852_9CUCU|nr:hypothetical protein NQ318_021865 [Aromia moschata]